MSQPPPDSLSIDDLVIDFAGRRLTRGGVEQQLEPKAFDVLALLAASPGRVFARDEILDAVWGRDVYVDERTVDVHVGRLRKSITRSREIDPIRTVRGMGYSFDERFGRLV